MDKKGSDKIEEKILAEKRVQTKALLMASEMLANIAPNDLKPTLLLPGYVYRISDKTAKFLAIDVFEGDADKVKEFAVGACEFLARVEGAIDAFIEQNIPGGGDK